MALARAPVAEHEREVVKRSPVSKSCMSSRRGPPSGTGSPSARRAAHAGVADKATVAKIPAQSARREQIGPAFSKPPLSSSSFMGRSNARGRGGFDPVLRASVAAVFGLF
jgi:hypothetical protein